MSATNTALLPGGRRCTVTPALAAFAALAALAALACVCSLDGLGDDGIALGVEVNDAELRVGVAAKVLPPPLEGGRAGGRAGVRTIVNERTGGKERTRRGERRAHGVCARGALPTHRGGI